MTTLWVQYWGIPWGDRRSHTSAAPIELRPTDYTTGNGALRPAPAPEIIVPQPPQEWKFAFWSWHDGVSTDPTTGMPTVSQGDAMTVTAWYRPWPDCLGARGPGLETWAFSETGANLIFDVPIRSVVPAAQWTPPDALVVTIPSAVSVTARANIRAEDFRQWIILPSNGSTQERAGLTFPGTPNEDALCIAVYGPVPPPVPPFDSSGSAIAQAREFARRLLIEILAGDPDLAAPATAKDEFRFVEHERQLATHELQQRLKEVRARLAPLEQEEERLEGYLKARRK